MANCIKNPYGAIRVFCARLYTLRINSTGLISPLPKEGGKTPKAARGLFSQAEIHNFQLSRYAG